MLRYLGSVSEALLELTTYGQTIKAKQCIVKKSLFFSLCEPL